MDMRWLIEIKANWSDLIIVDVVVSYKSKLCSGQHVSQCKLMLSEAGDPTDKIQLLNHFSQTIPVGEGYTFIAAKVWVYLVLTRDDFI